MKKMKTVKQLKVTTVKQLFSSPKRWCKKACISDGEMSCCLVGAAQIVYLKPANREAYENAISKIFDVLNERRKKQKKAPYVANNHFEKFGIIASWNDSSSVTFEKVKEVVHKAKI
jgi:hypothetical protein